MQCTSRLVCVISSGSMIFLNDSFWRFFATFVIWTYIGWTIGVLGFDSRRGLGIFLFTTVFRTALGPTQSPIQWVTGTLSLGVKRPGREDDHSPPSSAEVKEWMELYLHSQYAFMAWCSVKKKSTETTLPFTLMGRWYKLAHLCYSPNDIKEFDQIYRDIKYFRQLFWSVIFTYNS
jgi:hypothetical protein